MTYKLVKESEATQKDKFGIHLHVYPATGGVGFVTVETEEGHNQEFYDLESTFTYIILEGEGTFYLDDVEVPVRKGDWLSVEPKTRIYYKGKLKMVLLTSPAWKAENEVETRKQIW